MGVLTALYSTLYSTHLLYFPPLLAYSTPIRDIHQFPGKQAWPRLFPGYPKETPRKPKESPSTTMTVSLLCALTTLLTMCPSPPVGGASLGRVWRGTHWFEQKPLSQAQLRDNQIIY